ncbi:MAG: hypothetical protein RMX65_012110 [Nostoc sp. DedQUE01]
MTFCTGLMALIPLALMHTIKALIILLTSTRVLSIFRYRLLVLVAG